MLEATYAALRRSPALATLLSLLLGFGLAAMLRPLCAEGCGPSRGPPASSVRDRVFQYGDGCVEFVPHPVRCPRGQSDAAAVVPTVSEEVHAAGSAGLL